MNSLKSPVAISCADTKCGDLANFNYGANWGDITTACSYADSVSTCTLQCPGDLYPYPTSTVICDQNQLISPATDETEIYCAKTACGNPEDFFNIKPDEVISECSENGCVLTCVWGNKVPTVKYLTCSDGQFEQTEASQELIECYEPEDFGNVFYNLIAADDTFAG